MLILTAKRVIATHEIDEMESLFDDVDDHE